MFHHSVEVQETSISADAIETFELGVNPLSVLLLHLKPLNETSTLSNFQRYLGIVGGLNRVSVLHQGSTVVRGSGRDLAALNYFRRGLVPRQAHHDDADDERRSVVLPIFFSRYPYDPQECFPASRRGQLQVEIDFDVADTGYDGMRLSIETVELPDAKPKAWERILSVSETFAATGEQRVELPLGRQVRGLLLFGTTAFGGSSPSPTWGRVETHVENQQVGYASVDWEVAHMLSALPGGQPPLMDNHTHRVDTSGASTTQESTGPIEVGSGGWENYAYLSFEPSGDDSHVLDLRRVNDANIHSDAEAADLVRVLTVEKMT